MAATVVNSLDEACLHHVYHSGDRYASNRNRPASVSSRGSPALAKGAFRRLVYAAPWHLKRSELLQHDNRGTGAGSSSPLRFARRSVQLCEIRPPVLI